MHVGILGNHWGRVHCGTSRRAGCEIHALVGADPETSAVIARQEGVPHSTPEALESADIIVIATPARTHRQFVERFARKAILCEKPLLGQLPGEPFTSLARRMRLFVNYAFPFLPSAGAFARALRVGAPGKLESIVLTVHCGLPSIESAREALVEVAVHPLAFLLTLLGPMEPGCSSSEERSIRVDLVSEMCPISLHVVLGGQDGFSFDLQALGDSSRLSLSGGYRSGTRWAFDPVLLGGQAILGPVSSRELDVWYEANCALVSAFVAHLRGEGTPGHGRDSRLLDGDGALGIERALTAVL